MGSAYQTNCERLNWFDALPTRPANRSSFGSADTTDYKLIVSVCSTAHPTINMLVNSAHKTDYKLIVFVLSKILAILANKQFLISVVLKIMSNKLHINDSTNGY